MVTNRRIETCPRCQAAMEQGFCHRNVGLSFVAPAKLARFLFIDEDVARAGLSKLLPWKARYYPSSLCRACNLYVVDFGTSLSSAEAKAAALMVGGPHGDR